MAYLEILRFIREPHRVGARVEVPGDFEGLVIDHADGQWWAQCKSYDTRHNGSHAQGKQVRLEHRDVLDANGYSSVRFCEHDDDTPPLSPLEATVAAQPSDDARWQVWADWLAEQGDVRAELVHEARVEPAVERLRRLGGLCALAIDGALVVDWRRGFLRAATLRSVGHELQLPPHVFLSELWRLECAAFLEHVHVDLWGISHEPEDELDLLLGGLGEAPRSLATFTVGPRVADAAAVRPSSARALVGLRERLPRLATDASSLITTFRRCKLTGPTGAVVRVTLANAYVELGDLLVSLTRQGAYAASEARRGAVSVNGHRIGVGRLLHGDRFQVDGGPTWTIEYE